MNTENKRWEPINLIFIGTIKDVVRSGGGKLTQSAVDTGEEDRKPPGQELE